MLLFYYNNQNDQEDKTNGFEMEGLEGVELEREKLEKEGVKDLYFFKAQPENMQVQKVTCSCIIELNEKWFDQYYLE
jgi:hypothetical protein